MHRFPIHIARVGFALLLTFCGCSHLSRLPAWRTGSRPEGEARATLEAAARRQRAVEDLNCQGQCIVASPELLGKRKFQVTMKFRMPGDLVVRGFDSSGLGGQLLLLAVLDGETRAVFPDAGVEAEELLGQAPSEYVARELLFPEDWADLKARKLRLVDTETGGGQRRYTFLLKKRLGFYRRFTLEEPGGVLRASELFHRNGQLLAHVEWQEYADINGTSLPARFEAHFPQAELRLQFRIDASRIVLNSGLPTEEFRSALEDAERILNEGSHN